MHKFLINFNYILFSLIIFILQSNVRKSFFKPQKNQIIILHGYLENE